MTTATKYKSYPKYKPSQSEWLDNVPEKWAEKRLKFLISQKITDGPHDTPEFILEGVPFLSVDGIQDDRLVFDGCRHISPENHAQYKQKCFPRKGDILLGKAASVGKVAIVDVDFEFNVWSPLALIRANKQVLPKYIYYSFKADTLQDQVLVLSTSNTQHNLSMDDIPELWLTLPNTEEQKEIITFLDHETEKIDEMVGKKQKMTELLKEKRQALITRAVTKGLDPKVKMKPSGIDWLDDIPTGWEVKKAKFSSDFISGYSFDSESYTDDGVPIIRIGDIAETIDFKSVKKVPADLAVGLEKFSIKKGDILLALTGATIGKTAIYNSMEFALLNQRVAILRGKNLDQKYLTYFIASSIFKENIDYLCFGGAQENIGKSEIGSIMISYPKINEQKEIVAFLDRETAKIDEMMKKVEIQIEKLQEYRQALITSAVTGKIMVN